MRIIHRIPGTIAFASSLVTGGFVLSAAEELFSEGSRPLAPWTLLLGALGLIYLCLQVAIRRGNRPMGPLRFRHRA